MRRLKALWRLCRVGTHLMVGLWRVWTRFPGWSQDQRDLAVQAWALEFLDCLAIKLVVHGSPPERGPMLLAANHISWLDIVVMHAARHCRFVSKDEVRRWPLVSTLANSAGTLYLSRESRRDALRVVHQMADCLRAGEVLAVFPEGTTGDGSTLLPFHANLLQAALVVDAPVQPISLQFADGGTGDISFAPCYVGDDTLMQSLWRTLCADNVVAVVRFGTPQLAMGRDRRAWSTDLRDSIAAMRSTHPLA